MRKDTLDQLTADNLFFALSPSTIPSMSKTRAELRWTKPGPGEDEEFMMKLLPEYENVHALGKMRQTNPHKRLWLRARLEDYKTAFPGRVEDEWRLSGIGPNSTSDEIHKKRIQVSSIFHARV